MPGQTTTMFRNRPPGWAGVPELDGVERTEPESDHCVVEIDTAAEHYGYLVTRLRSLGFRHWKDMQVERRAPEPEPEPEIVSVDVRIQVVINSMTKKEMKVALRGGGVRGYSSWSERKLAETVVELNLDQDGS